MVLLLRRDAVESVRVPSETNWSSRLSASPISIPWQRRTQADERDLPDHSWSAKQPFVLWQCRPGTGTGGRQAPV